MTIPHTFHAVPTGTKVPGAYLDDDFSFVGKTGSIPTTAAGTNTIALAPVTATTVAFTALQNGLTVNFVAAGNNTTTTTINFAGLGALPAYNSDGSAITTAGTLIAGSGYVAIYRTELNSGGGGWFVLGTQSTSAIAPLFATRTAAAASHIATGVNLLYTAGYYTIGDLGYAGYYRSNTLLTGGFDSADGAHWALLPGVGCPEMMGAHGDGAINPSTGSVTGTDDTVAIQNAIEYFAVVSFRDPSKIYRISAVLTAWCINITTSNHTIYGNGATLALEDSGSFTLEKIALAFTGLSNARITNIKVYGLGVYGNGLNQGTVVTNEYSGIQFIWCDGFICDGCFVQQVCGDGIATGGSINGVISNNRVYYSGKNNIYLPGDGGTPGGIGPIEVIGNDCLIPNWNFNGAFPPIFGGLGYTCIGITSVMATVVGNNCNCASQGGGISITALTATTEASRVTVSGNVIQAPLGNGISLAGATANATTFKAASITGNTIVSAAQAGINVNWSEGFVIADNFVYGSGTFGILLNGRSVDFSITGNDVVASGGAGIGLIGARSGLIDGNTVNASGGWGLTFGDSETLGVLANQDITIGDNSFTSNVSGGIDLANLANFTSRTIATIDASYTPWNPGTVASGAIATTTQALAGVTMASRVLGATLSTLTIGGVTLYGAPNAANSIVVTALNSTGGNWTPANGGTLRVTVRLG